MKLLVDESLSIRFAELLRDGGHETLHVHDLRLLGASDDDVLEAAVGHQSVLITADTDFGGLLALAGRSRPSVVILRRAPHRPDQQAQLLLATLPDLEHHLSSGSVVTLMPGRARVRRLPIDSQ